MFSKSILRSAWLDDQDLASWTTLAQFLGELLQQADQAGHLTWGVAVKTVEAAAVILTKDVSKLPEAQRTLTQQRTLAMPLPAHSPAVMGAGNAMYRAITTGMLAGEEETIVNVASFRILLPGCLVNTDRQDPSFTQLADHVDF